MLEVIDEQAETSLKDKRRKTRVDNNNQLYKQFISIKTDNDIKNDNYNQFKLSNKVYNKSKFGLNNNIQNNVKVYKNSNSIEFNKFKSNSSDKFNYFNLLISPVKNTNTNFNIKKDISNKLLANKSNVLSIDNCNICNRRKSIDVFYFKNNLTKTINNSPGKKKFNFNTKKTIIQSKTPNKPLYTNTLNNKLDLDEYNNNNLSNEFNKTSKTITKNNLLKDNEDSFNKNNNLSILNKLKLFNDNKNLNIASYHRLSINQQLLEEKLKDESNKVELTIEKIVQDFNKNFITFNRRKTYRQKVLTTFMENNDKKILNDTIKSIDYNYNNKSILSNKTKNNQINTNNMENENVLFSNMSSKSNKNIANNNIINTKNNKLFNKLDFIDSNKILNKFKSLDNSVVNFKKYNYCNNKLRCINNWMRVKIIINCIGTIHYLRQEIILFGVTPKVKKRIVMENECNNIYDTKNNANISFVNNNKYKNQESNKNNKKVSFLSNNKSKNQYSNNTLQDVEVNKRLSSNINTNFFKKSYPIEVNNSNYISKLNCESKNSIKDYRNMLKLDTKTYNNIISNNHHKSFDDIYDETKFNKKKTIEYKKHATIINANKSSFKINRYNKNSRFNKLLDMFNSNYKLKYRVKPLIIYSNSLYSKIINIVIFISLMFSLTIVPFRLSFCNNYYNSDYKAWFSVDVILNIIFFLHIVINFNKAYYKDNGLIVDSHSKIACQYIGSWFFLDLICLFPYTYYNRVTTIHNWKHTNNYSIAYWNEIIPLARIFRLSSILSNIHIADYVGLILKLSAGKLKLIMFFLESTIICHLFACIWFFSAKVNMFSPNTWVNRYDWIDESTELLYIKSLYYTYVVFITVGYGDIVAFSNSEILLCIIFMVFTAIYYTYYITLLSNIFMNMQYKRLLYNDKCMMISDICKSAKISVKLENSIKKFVKIYFEKDNSSYSIEELKVVLNEMPSTLKLKVKFNIYFLFIF